MSRRLGPEAEILALLVDGGHRRQGLATELLARTIAFLEDRGVRSLFLEVAEDNAPALALYDRFRFARVGRRRDYYERKDGGFAAALNLRLDLRGRDHPIGRVRMDRSGEAS